MGGVTPRLVPLMKTSPQGEIANLTNTYSTGSAGLGASVFFASRSGLFAAGVSFTGGATAAAGEVATFAAGAGTVAGAAWRFIRSPTDTARIATTAIAVPSRGLRRRLWVTKEAEIASLSRISGELPDELSPLDRAGRLSGAGVGCTA